ncbi:YegS/Rv2252/BmrU family lipid kinase [Agrococcus baldri]|uniref:Diacylglycerol kinase n=1 Tax=Agrococcus baldri TaxID=153730 RepID=A0AA87RB86_9MICO|nr:YegS/Rv2252/BmrU family lipid kinase [Agrococcus baldri]GEK79671.1 diacylglycerol kinase [Agrococcus baldri]
MADPAADAAAAGAPVGAGASARIAVLVNPVSGRGRGRDAADAVVARLRELGAEVLVSVGSSVEQSRQLAAAAVAARPAALVIIGGDGTLSTLLDALVGCGVPIALVPAGTGNDFARAIGVPIGPSHAAEAAALALQGRPRPIDVGRVETADAAAHFLTVVAMGFDARVSDRTNRLRWPRGRARYYLALLIELARLRPVPFRVAVDDGPARARPGTLIAIGNTGSYGGGMPICPDSLPDDGQLDVTHVGPLSRIRLLRLFPLLLAGRHLERPEATALRATSVRVEAPGLVVYADGERIGTGSATVTVRPGALTMLVPQVAR